MNEAVTDSDHMDFMNHDLKNKLSVSCYTGGGMVSVTIDRVVVVARQSEILQQKTAWLHASCY